MAGEIALVVFDRVGHRVQGKRDNAKQSKTSMFCECNDFVLRELGIEQVHQILRASVAFGTYGLKDKRIFLTFWQLFRANQCPVGFMNGGSYLQRVVQTSQTWLGSSKEIEESSTLEQLLFFQELSFVESLIRQKSVRTLRIAAVQTVDYNGSR